MEFVLTCFIGDGVACIVCCVTFLIVVGLIWVGLLFSFAAGWFLFRKLLTWWVESG